MTNSTLTRRTFAAGAALTLALALGGCSTVQSIFGGKDASRDENTGQVTEQGKGSAFELKAGDCLKNPEDDQFQDVTLLPCDQPHDAEVIVNYNASGDTFDSDAIEAEAEKRCAAEFTTYVGVEPENSAEHWYNYFTPLAKGWKSGDRQVTCLVIKLDDKDKLVQSTSSAKGIAK